MSYSSYINNPSYVASTGTVVPANVQNFYNSTEVQSYLNNNPTTSYTLSNLYNDLITNPATTFYAQTIPILSGTQYIQVLQSVYDADPDNVSILDLTIPAGTYNVSIQGVICTANGIDTYIHVAELLLYNRAGGDADTSCPSGLMVSSSVNTYNSVADANVFLILKGYQRLVLTTNTVVSMALKISNVNSAANMYYGTSTNNVNLSASITFEPTI
jgi:hypothetical protein